jgi:hypothetical protein
MRAKISAATRTDSTPPHQPANALIVQSYPRSVSSLNSPSPSHPPSSVYITERGPCQCCHCRNLTVSKGSDAVRAVRYFAYRYAGNRRFYFPPRFSHASLFPQEREQVFSLARSLVNCPPQFVEPHARHSFAGNFLCASFRPADSFMVHPFPYFHHDCIEWFMGCRARNPTHEPLAPHRVQWTAKTSRQTVSTALAGALSVVVAFHC